MFKRLLYILPLIILFTSCSKTKYDVVEDVIDDMICYEEDFVSALAKAEKAEDVASALNEFSDDMQSLNSDIEKVGDKFPDMMNSFGSSDEMPDSLKKKLSKQADLMRELGYSIEKKVPPFINDDKVAEAMIRLNKVL